MNIQNFASCYLNKNLVCIELDYKKVPNFLVTILANGLVFDFVLHLRPRFVVFSDVGTA